MAPKSWLLQLTHNNKRSRIFRFGFYLFRDISVRCFIVKVLWKCCKFGVRWTFSMLYRFNDLPPFWMRKKKTHFLFRSASYNFLSRFTFLINIYRDLETRCEKCQTRTENVYVSMTQIVSKRWRRYRFANHFENGSLEFCVFMCLCVYVVCMWKRATKARQNEQNRTKQAHTVSRRSNAFASFAIGPE